MQTKTAAHADLLAPSETLSFADVAHQTLTFSRDLPSDSLVLSLIDTPWVQRLRRISQTGNTKLVYMFAEHSRFGHSLGVAYLACELMKKLREQREELVAPYQSAVAAAAILHDVGHVAPGSHLAERVWSQETNCKHETLSIRVLQEDEQIRGILDDASAELAEQVTAILDDSERMPPWTRAIISGAGWNADRGNWAIVDSAMCAVSYGRYNVTALLDAFRLTEDGMLVLQESRIDALTHFFVARDSMYRQIYQHRVLQAVDIITLNIVARARELFNSTSSDVFADDTMAAVLAASNYASELSLEQLFQMTESWWGYHIEQWCRSADPTLADLASRLRDRRLFKTVRLDDDADSLIGRARELLEAQGLDPRYYLRVVNEADKHRGSQEEPPLVLLDNGKVKAVTEVEPLIAQILARKSSERRWLAVPSEIKQALGAIR